MTRTVTAVFDGETLRPSSPVDLEPNTRYLITIREAPHPEKRPSHRDLRAATDHVGDLCRQTPERLPGGVHDQPVSLAVSWFGYVSFHGMQKAARLGAAPWMIATPIR